MTHYEHIHVKNHLTSLCFVCLFVFRTKKENRARASEYTRRFLCLVYKTIRRLVSF